MKTGKFSDFIFGLAGFTVSDGFADEFISGCVKKKIVIHNLKRTENTITGYVHFADIKSITDISEKSGMSLKITERYGLPHIFFRYRKRYGIPAGLLIFTVITAILHSVVWSVDITPTEYIPTEMIIAALEEAGARVGVFSDSVNCKEAEYLLHEKFEDISWVNVRITGTRMFVDISEVKVREHQKTQSNTNIVAAKDGEIVNAEILRGEGKIYPGTAVVRGDLLVSGIIEYRDGSVKFVDSEAKIFARTKNFVSSSIPPSITVSRLKKCKDIYLPVFFGLSLSDVIGVKTENLTEARYFIDGGDVILPVGISRKHTYSLEESVVELNENESALLCFRDFSGLCLKLYKNAEILECDIKLSSSNGAEFCGNFLTVEDIALKKEFTVEEASPSR